MRQSTWTWGAVLVGLALGASGCAGVRAACPEQGGPMWHEVTSAHFVVRTNLEPEAAEQAVMKLERYRRALLLAWGPDFDPPGQVQVRLLRSARELGEFTTWNSFRGWDYTDTDRLVLVLHAGAYPLSDEWPDFSPPARALARELSGKVLVRQPVWLSVGLSAYLETIELRENGARAVLGKVHTDYAQYLAKNGRLPLDVLWRWGQERPRGDAREHRAASSWFLVYFLLNEHSDRFADFQRRLAQAQAPRKAWAEAFAGLDEAELDRQLTAYFKHGRHETLTVRVPPVTTDLELRTLSDAEVHAARAELLVTGPGPGTGRARVEAAQRELDAALSASPDALEPSIIKGRLTADRTARLTLYRRLTVVHPESSDAWQHLADALGDEAPAERIAAYERAVERAPEDAHVLNGLAWALVLKGEGARALELAERALRAQPHDPAILDTYAGAAALVGRCDDALAAQRQAVELLPEWAGESERKELPSRLDTYEQRCGGMAKP